MSYFNPELKLKDTESPIKNKLQHLLKKLKGFQFLTKLVLQFWKVESDDEIKYAVFYLPSKVETIINKSDIDDVFGSIDSTIISNIEKLLGKN